MEHVALTSELTGPDANDRTHALASWCARFDPQNKLDPIALRDAAALAALVPTACGKHFEPDAFRELVDFIAEMPF